MSTNQCTQCSKTFQITEADQAFYQKINTPSPTLCPDCRSQRRLVWRNERTLYARQCDLCHKSIIALYHTNSPYMVYCYDCWYSDKWDPLSFGQNVDWSRPFFEQFKELQLKVPRLYAMMVNNENCEYTNGTLGCKDCYMIFASDHNEHCMYSYGIFSSVSTLDTLNGKKCELCYDCIGCTNCFKVQYSEDSSNCNNASFLLDCKGCSDCFMSNGLRNRTYVWQNEQLTVNEYNERLSKLKFGSNQTIKRLKADFKELKKKHTFKFYHGQNNDHFSGDYLERCHNTQQAFECYEIDNCKFITHGNQVKDCYDGYMNVDQCELGYELVGAIGAYNTKFAAAFYTGSDSYYADTCKQVKHTFGCVGLQNQQYCILNKQYSEEEYFVMKDKLIELMKQGPAREVSSAAEKTPREWGEFFPVTCSPFAYNETAAMDVYPLTQKDVTSRGWAWNTPEAKQARYSSYRLPDAIETVKDDILQTFLTCENCQAAYKIIPTELTFYREQTIPVPRQCFNCRQISRLHEHTPRALWQRNCMCTQADHGHRGKCPTSFETAYSSENLSIVYCEECYNKTIS